MPGGNNVNLYAPSAPVVAVRAWLVSVLVTVTVTFGMMAPEASVTAPASAPVPADWATREGIQAANNNRTTASLTIFICIPLLRDPDTRTGDRFNNKPRQM